MALAGSGTQASPYEITSYADLKEYSDDTSYTGNYLKLMNNIDCKTYGSQFVWNTITFRGDSTNNYAYFDLDGKTIKNVSIAAGEYMFNSNNTANTVTFISNGNLENIYAYTAMSVFYGYTDFNNVGISINLTGIQSNAFGMGHHSSLHNCGVRLKADATVPYVFVYSNSATDPYLLPIIEDTDFILDFKNANGLSNISSGVSGVEFKNCRFTGKVTGWPHYFIYANILTNIVIDIDFSECVYGGSDPTWYSNRMYPAYASTYNGVVLDVEDNFPTYEQAEGYYEIESRIIQAQDNEITSGQWLREHNFEVVNVSS